MTITTSNGKTAEIELICFSSRDGRKLLIELEDERPLSEIAADFEGLESIKAENERARGSAYEVYKGYTLLTGVQRIEANGLARITLEKGA